MEKGQKIHRDTEISEGLPRQAQIIVDSPGIPEKSQLDLICGTQPNSEEFLTSHHVQSSGHVVTSETSTPSKAQFHL